MRRKRTVAVLGAGIMGSSAALHLARLGTSVSLFDREHAPFRGASRWNEGKIHLGFLYAADRSLSTARSILPGGLDFSAQVESLTERSIRAATTPVDDLYLLHRDSVIKPEAAAGYFGAVAALVREHHAAPRYMVDVSGSRVEKLAPSDLEELADPLVAAAGYRVPERSVDTNFVADAFVEALEAETAISLVMGQDVTAVSPAEEGTAGRWSVHAGDERHGPFDAVVNALWEGRPAVDRSVGHFPDADPQHRHRVSLFVRTKSDLDLSSAVLAVGPFGDVKNYSGRDFYLSWYPAGLLARSESVDPPAAPQLLAQDRDRIVAEVFDALGAILPWTREIERAASDVRVEGGWVYSQGRGALDDPRAGVHRRDRLGVSRLGSYYSVDTGKYSVAPTLAEAVARMVVGD